eukprot:2762124-Rhodomonas_salina.2
MRVRGARRTLALDASQFQPTKLMKPHEHGYPRASAAGHSITSTLSGKPPSLYGSWFRTAGPRQYCSLYPQSFAPPPQDTQPRSTHAPPGHSASRRRRESSDLDLAVAGDESRGAGGHTGPVVVDDDARAGKRQRVHSNLTTRRANCQLRVLPHNKDDKSEVE